MGIGTLFSGALSGTATAVVGAAGALALIGLHLLRLRRREVVVSFAPFWLGLAGAERATRWARRLRQWLALALALAIFGLVLLAAAEPRPASADRTGRTIVILIDRSASMSARDEPGTRLGAARARATEIVDGLGRADRTLVASFAHDAIAESGFEADAARLRQAIAAVTPSEEPGDLGRALDFAAAILHGRPRPTVVLVSDGGFPDDARRAAPPLLDLRYLPVGRRGQNVGIVSFAARRLPADPGAVEAAFSVQNFGPSRVAIAVEILASGKPVDRLHLELAPGELRRHELPSVFAPDARLEARLLGSDGRALEEGDGAGADDLALDNRAFAVVPPLPRRRVLRVGGPDLYLDGALLSLGRTVAVERRDAAAAARDRDRWPDYDLVLFDGVAPEPLPRAGRYLYLDPHGPGSPFAEHGVVREPVIAEVRRDHPLVRQVDLADVNIAEARRLALAPGDVSVAGSFGVPLLVARERPGLRIAATSFDPRRSDLPMRAAFPLLLANVLAWTGGHDAEGRSAPASTTGSTARLADGVTEVPIARVGFQRVGDDVVAANLADARESDTAPARVLSLDGHALAPPDPPARRGVVRLPVLALLLAAALAMFEWVSFQRRWTT